MKLFEAVSVAQPVVLVDVDKSVVAKHCEFR